MEKDTANLLGCLTLAEKALLCSGQDGWHTKPIEHVAVGSVMMADGTSGLRRERPSEDGGKPVTEPATSFPSECLMACSFDVDLLRKVGETFAAEAHEKGVDLLLGPGVNLKRSPLCGRNFEYYSEDPHLTGELAAAFVEGLQGAGVGATLKHYALNNQEKARLSYSALADERAKRELYLAAFETVIRKCEPWAVMTAYNRADGLYMSENVPLLRGVLRDEWGYKGLVMSDWGAVSDRLAALRAGLDLEMPFSGGYRDRMIEEAVKDGRLDEALVDESAGRVLELVRKAERSRPKQPPLLDPEQQHALARRFATE